MADLQRPKEEILAASDAVYNYVLDLETKLEASWAGKHVAIVAVVAFVLGWIV